MDAPAVVRSRSTHLCLAAALVLALIVGLVAVGGPGPSGATSPTAFTPLPLPTLFVQPAAAVRSPAPSLTPRERALRAYAAMTPKERVGQLVMAGVPSTGSSAAQRATLRRYEIGNVYLAGNTGAGRATVGARVAKVRVAATSERVRPFVSVDQEGGLVQRLTGAGFDRMPTALAQGRLAPKTLKARASRWAKQLAAAGVNLDLAPVADVVPKKGASRNQPIGRWKREYGHTPAHVSPRVAAVVRGMAAGGVATSAKHFPGLGRATGNTDFAGKMTDPTSRGSSYLKPFRAAVDAGVPFVMVSSATYPNIDAKRRACFSRTVMRDVLRGDLGFDGVIVSDDVGAAALRSVPWGERATRFVAAGGTMVLTTSTARVGVMTKAIRAKVREDAAFAATVRSAVLTVLEAKAAVGLLR